MQFLEFWYLSAPARLAKYFLSLNHSVLEILSLPILLKTFFRPIKNEYRKGLVGFSIGMGIFIKSVLIFIDLIFLLGLLIVESILFVLFLLWPFLTVFILFR